jgi:hypothetical protein
VPLANQREKFPLFPRMDGVGLALHRPMVFWLKVKLLAKTIPAVLKGVGAA